MIFFAQLEIVAVRQSARGFDGTELIVLCVLAALWVWSSMARRRANRVKDVKDLSLLKQAANREARL